MWNMTIPKVSQRLNLIVLVKENTDYIKLFADLRLVNPTIAISLANQVSI